MASHRQVLSGVMCVPPIQRSMPRSSTRSASPRSVCLSAAGTNADGAGGGIDPHAFHHRHVDHQPVIDTAKARPIVSASADRNPKIVLLCKIDGSDNVSDVGASRNHLGALIDHPVVEAAHSIIVDVRSPDDGAAHVADEGFSGPSVLPSVAIAMSPYHGSTYVPA